MKKIIIGLLILYYFIHTTHKLNALDTHWPEIPGYTTDSKKIATAPVTNITDDAQPKDQEPKESINEPSDITTTTNEPNS